jgi:hypothetical protein
MTDTSNYEISVEKDVAAVMGDGTALRADVYHPSDDQPYPVLLCRTPYQDGADDGEPVYN